jgi:hypothetical protein
MELIINLDVDPAEPQLVDADVFDALKVTVTGGDASDAGLASALATVGTLEAGGENAFLEVEALAGLAGSRAADPEWRAGFDRMVSYAAEHGWVDGEGRVQAHVERA